MQVKGMIWLGNRTSNFNAIVNSYAGAMEDGYARAHFRAPSGFIYELTYSPKHPAR